MAAKLNNKLNYQPKEEDDVNITAAGAENTFKKYEEELEINDFPQQARWKVTSKVCNYCSFKSNTLLVFFLLKFNTISQQLITKNKNTTNRSFSFLQEALAQISEYSEAGLTVRGTYVPTGKTVPEGERKLYLAIESCSEMSVQKAKREITRLIKEELLKLSHVHPVFNKGRYKVL